MQVRIQHKTHLRLNESKDLRSQNECKINKKHFKDVSLDRFQLTFVRFFYLLKCVPLGFKILLETV